MHIEKLIFDYDQFINKCVTTEGNVVNAYTGRAVPAESKILEMDAQFRGFVPGIVLIAAAQILK